MTAPESTGELITTLVDRFEAALASSRRTAKHQIDHSEFIDMMFRMIRALERRAIDDAQILPQIRALGARMDEVVNVAIAANAERYDAAVKAGQIPQFASAAECGRALGISKQSASERRARGRAVMAARIAAAGVVRFSERQREREMIAAADEVTVVALADFRARRSA